MIATSQRTLTIGAAAPFLVAVCLFVLMLLAALTGMAGPSSNTYFVVAAAAIIIGLVAGIGSLLMLRQGRKWIRVLVGLSYIPVVLFSLLAIGA